MNNLFIGSKQIKLGEKLGSGGEGEVFKLEDNPNLAVKIYNESIRNSRESKVREMISKIPEKYRNSCIVFPLDIVTSNNQFVGFTMETVNGYKPIHLLYTPKSRSYEFPYADYRFIVRVAKNVALAVAQVHQSGCIIGDINQSGILVSEKDATVKIIDTDSFQFSSANNLYPCEVGMEDYTPPELQGISLKGKVRTISHDNFGLAIIVFQLLFMGMHPYAGTCSIKDLTMGQAIKENRFAYSLVRANETQTHPAKNALTLDLFPEYLRQAFENAFGKTASFRPDAKDWITLLSTFEKELSQCHHIKSHFFFKASENCIWCNYLKKIHFNFFSNPTTSPIHILKDVFLDINVITNYIQSYFDIKPLIDLPALFKTCFERETGLSSALISQKAEKNFERVRDPIRKKSLELKNSLSKKYESMKEEGLQGNKLRCFLAICFEILGVWIFCTFKTRELGGLSFFLIFAMLVAGSFIMIYSSEEERINKQYKANCDSISTQTATLVNKEYDSYVYSLKSKYEVNKKNFTNLYNDCISYFRDSKFQKLINLRSEILQLITEYNSCEKNKENAIDIEIEKQKQQYNEKIENAFLCKFYLQKATIPSIGPQRKYVLNANGIYTAADISKQSILGIDGFGDYLTECLLSWKNDLLKNFHVNDTNFRIDSSQVERIKSIYNEKKIKSYNLVNSKFKDFTQIMENTNLSTLMTNEFKKRRELFKLYADILEQEREMELFLVKYDPLSFTFTRSFISELRTILNT